jgi:alpha-D-ribose 1-methylphosphonate 5-triphosphate synthase subunit PhnG
MISEGLPAEDSQPGASARERYTSDYTLCECDLEPLRCLVEQLETRFSIEIRRQPSICLTMIPAEDSLEAQRFYLGEALTTECEVAVDGHTGFGLCLGEEPVRCYCIAVIDALLNRGTELPAEVEAFLHEQGEAVRKRDQDEFDLILQTQVDFKLMEEA